MKARCSILNIDNNFIKIHARRSVLRAHIRGDRFLKLSSPENCPSEKPGFFDQPAVAVIGSRRASPYGEFFLREFFPALEQAFKRQVLKREIGTPEGSCPTFGLPLVISGGAMGIDAWAHLHALEAGFSTWAWLVGPMRSPSPAKNRGLFMRMAQTPGSGILVPECLEPSLRAEKIGPYRSDWIDRNAWLVAASDALVVIEAEVKSGTWASVRMANEIGIPVYALPGSVFSSKSTGTNLMISSGYAHPILSVEKLVEALVVDLSLNLYN